MNWLNLLLGPVTDAFNKWRDRKHQLKTMKHALKLKKVEAQINIITAEAQSRVRMNEQAQMHEQSWELAAMKNSGWKDEYITVLFTLPAIGIFIPMIQDYVYVGFQQLSATPFWYQMVLLGIVGAALGIRIWDSFAKPFRMGKGSNG